MSERLDGAMGRVHWNRAANRGGNKALPQQESLSLLTHFPHMAQPILSTYHQMFFFQQETCLWTTSGDGQRADFDRLQLPPLPEVASQFGLPPIPALSPIPRLPTRVSNGRLAGEAAAAAAAAATAVATLSKLRLLLWLRMSWVERGLSAMAPLKNAPLKNAPLNAASNSAPLNTTSNTPPLNTASNSAPSNTASNTPPLNTARSKTASSAGVDGTVFGAKTARGAESNARTQQRGQHRSTILTSAGAGFVAAAAVVSCVAGARLTARCVRGYPPPTPIRPPPLIPPPPPPSSHPHPHPPS